MVTMVNYVAAIFCVIGVVNCISLRVSQGSGPILVSGTEHIQPRTKRPPPPPTEVTPGSVPSPGNTLPPGLEPMTHPLLRLGPSSGGGSAPGNTLPPVTSQAPGEGYTASPSGKQYKLHRDPQPWAEAAKVCEGEGAQLAVIDSELESSFLTKMMLDGLADMDVPVALLGYSRGGDRQFTTITGKPLDTTGFQRMSHSGPELMGPKGGNCGSLQRDGGIGRFPCQTPIPFLCEKLNDTVTTTTPSLTTSTPATTTMSPPVAAGYELLAGLGWYKIHGDNKKWHDAARACEAEGTHLAVLNSDAEAKALKLMMTRQRGVNYGPCHCALIGFHDLSKEGHFVTVFGDPLESTGFTKWGPGNPDNSGNDEDCGSITYRGDLNDLSCKDAYPFICEHSTGTLAYNSSINANATTYQPVYESFPGVGAYKLHTDGKKWSDAKEACEREGASLGVVNTDAESDVIRKLIGRNPDLELAEGRAVYLGFSDAAMDGNFKTVFGQPLEDVGFSRWGKERVSQPGDNATCGGLNRKGELVSVSCFLKAPFVCEKMDGTTNSGVYRPPLATYSLLAGLGFYRFSARPATWHEAKATCESEDAHLAVINSDAEAQQFRRLVAANPDQRKAAIFLGFHDQTSEGKFETIFGTPLDAAGYNKWAPWSPDNFGRGEDCGVMDLAGYLNDKPCDAKLHFICERELNYTSARNAYNAPNRLTIDPEHIHVREGATLTVTCTTDEPLIECHFKTTNSHVCDLSRGQKTTIVTEPQGADMIHYSYSGRGLDKGDCGMRFTLSPGLHRIMVGCRARSLHGGWKYGYMSVQGSNAPPQNNVRLSATELLVRNNTEPLRLLWQASTPITSCKCILPSQSMETRLEDSSQQSSADIDSYDEEDEDDDDESFFGGLKPSLTSDSPVGYHGLGFKAGQCGIQMQTPREWNGYLWCGMGTDQAWDWRSAAIIVDKPPTAPELVIHATEHSEGAILEAECRVGPSRPVSNVTWYLGEEMIRQDSVDDSPTTMWLWPSDDQWITQKLTRQLKAEDRGKELVCEAGHVGLPSSTLRTRQRVIMEGSLLNRTFNVEEFGFEAGKPGFISIVITASPKPDITWHFDNITIKGGGHDATGRFLAAALTMTDSLSIHWNAKLFITHVTEEDFSRDFHLTAKNEFGAQAYKVVIVRARTTAPPTTTPTTTTTTTTTQGTSSTAEDVGVTTTEGDTTPGYTEYPDQAAVTTGEPMFQGKAVGPDAQAGWATAGAVTGIVIAVLLVHLALAAVFIYGRRSGWRFLPVEARRRFLPAMSMDNLVDEEN